MRTAILALSLALMPFAIWANGTDYDFEKDFETLRAFGLPDISGARRVEVELSWRGFPGAKVTWKGGDDYRCWLLKENDDGSAELIVHDGWRVRATRKNGAVPPKTSGELWLEGSWRPIDFQDELRDTIRAIERHGTDDHDLPRPIDDVGHLFLVAAQARQLGMKSKSDRLVKALVANVGDPKKIVNAALCRLATARCYELFAHHAKNRDLGVFARSLDDLILTSPAELTIIPYLKELSEQVHQRLESVASPELFGDNWSDDDRAQAKALFAAAGEVMNAKVVFWVFPPPPDNDYVYLTTIASLPPPVKNILKRGIDAIPLLTALRGDKALTGVFYFPDRSWSPYQKIVSNSWYDKAHGPIESSWLPRLASRGDIAKACLESVPPWPSRRNAISPLDWFWKNRDESQWQVALRYLKEGDYIQRAGAMAFLTRNASPTKTAALENFLIADATDTANRHESLAINYIKRKKGAARDFVERFAKSVPSSYPKYQLETARALVSERSLTDLADALTRTRGCHQRGPIVHELAIKIAASPNPTRAALELAVRQTDREKRRICLNVVDTLGLNSFRRYRDDAALWDKLYANTNYNETLFLDKRLVDFYAPENRPDYPLSETMGRTRVNNFERELAASIRAGHPRPPPSSGAVSPERRAELVRELENDAPSELAKRLETFNIDELLAIDDILFDNEKPSTHLLSYVNAIADVTVDSSFGDKFDELKALKGRHLSNKTPQELQKAFFASPRTAARFDIVRDRYFGKTRIEVSVPRPPVGMRNGRIAKGVILIDSTNAVSLRGHASWRYAIETRDGQDRVIFDAPSLSMETTLAQLVSATRDLSPMAEFRFQLTIMPPEPPKVISARDWDRTFETLCRFGLLDVSSAQRVNVSLSWRDAPEFPFHCLSDRAWLTRERDDGSADLVFLDAWKIRAEKSGSHDRDARRGPIIEGRWTPTDFKTELQEAERRVEETLGPYATSSATPEKNAAESLTLAAQARRRGMTDEAVRLFGLALEAGGGVEKALEAALCRLATARCYALCAHFAQDGDPRDFALALDDLLWECPPELAITPCLKALDMQARQRLSDAEIPDLTGDHWSDTDRAQAKALANARGEFPLSSYRSWVFPPSENHRFSNDAKPPPELAAILERGVNALPLLLTLRNDAYPTGVIRLPDHIDVFRFKFNSTRSPLPRLATRGELANAALASAVPFRKESAREVSPDPALWSEVNRGKTPEQFALLYLRDGNYNQQWGAFEFLTRSPSETSAKEIERALLDMAGSDIGYRLALEYARSRLSAAKGFAETFTQRVETVKGQTGARVDQYALTRINKAVNARSLDVLFKGLASGEIRWDEGVAEEIRLQSRWDKAPNPLRAILILAEKARDTTTLLGILALTRRFKKESPKLQDTADLWRRLLADKWWNKKNLPFIQGDLLALYPQKEVEALQKEAFTLDRKRTAEMVKKDFERLYQAGLPDVSRAQRVQVTLTCPEGPNSGFNGIQGYQTKGWQFATDSENVADLLLFDSWKVKAKLVDDLQRLDNDWSDSQSGFDFVAFCRPEDFAGEIRRMVQDAEDVNDYRKDQTLIYDSLPTIPLLAAQAYRLGLKDEALRLANASIAMNSDPQTVLSIGRQALATGEYYASYLKLAHDGDLKAFGDRLHASLREAPKEWPLARTLKTLSERLVSAPAAALSVSELDDTDRSLAEALAEAEPETLPERARFWLFPPTDATIGAFRENRRSPKTIAAILRRGPRAIPLLLALRDDPRLTALRQPQALSLDWIWAVNYYRTKEAVSVSKPATRGDIARFCLEALLPPVSEGEWVPPEKRLDAFAEWWKNHRADSPRQLALEYLSWGDPTQRDDALSFLLLSPDIDAKTIEDALISALGAPEIERQVEKFARLRGPKAKRVVDAFILRAKATGSGEVAAAKYGPLISGVDATTLADNLATGKTKWDKTVQTALWNALRNGQIPPERQLRFLLETAGKSDNPKLRLELLESFARHSFYDDGMRFSDYAALWKPLLNDAKHRDDTLKLIVKFHALQASFYLSWLVGMEKRRNERWRLELGEAMVKTGKDFQDSVMIAPKRQAELTVTLKKTAPENFRSFAKTLNASELLTLGEILKRDQPLNEKFLTYANTIRKIVVAPELKIAAEPLDKLKGRPFSSATLDALLETLRDSHMANSRCDIRRTSCLGGVSIRLRAFPKGQTPRRVNKFILSGYSMSAEKKGVGAGLGVYEVVERDGTRTAVPIAVKRSSRFRGDPERFRSEALKAFAAKAADSPIVIGLELEEYSP